MMTLDEMKLAVCEKLPELIEIRFSACFWKNPLWGRTTGDINWQLEGLQVCHEAEKVLTEDEQRDYQIHLYCLFDSDWTYNELKDLCFDLSWVSTWDMSHATYDQRLEALCRVWYPEKFKA